MADISEWSPTDDSNNQAPPNGWPENQLPSTVNNCARAMMGAIRRWYDTVTAQLATHTTNFANYLPLAGGIMQDGGATFCILRMDGTYNLTGSWQVISDARAKHSVQRYDRGLQAVLSLNPVRFKYRGSDIARFGLMAQDVAPVVPEMVGEANVGGETLQTLAPTHANYLLINAVKELAAQNAVLTARIQVLEENRNV